MTVLDSGSGWYRVRRAAGDEGYVANYLVHPLVPPAASRDMIVLGYYMQDNASPSWPSLSAHGDVLTSVSPWAWGITESGALRPVYGTEPHLADVLSHAGRRGLETYALIHNFNPGRGAFDEEIVNRLLTDPAVRERAIGNIVDAAVRWGVTGVQIDFENVPAASRRELTAFIAALARAARDAGLRLMMAVPAVTRATAGSAWTAAYDYKALAGHVDYLVLMAYDQHWRGSSPGPVASLQWVRDVIEYAVSPTGGAVPPAKLILGIPAYGYDWPAGGNQWADALAYSEAMERLDSARARDPRVSLEWSPDERVPAFRYAGREVWFENHQSIGHKLLLAMEYDLAGVALWRLGQEDPLVWDLMRRVLG